MRRIELPASRATTWRSNQLSYTHHQGLAYTFFLLSGQGEIYRSRNWLTSPAGQSMLSSDLFGKEASLIFFLLGSSGYCGGWDGFLMALILITVFNKNEFS